MRVPGSAWIQKGINYTEKIYKVKNPLNEKSFNLWRHGFYWISFGKKILKNELGGHKFFVKTSVNYRNIKKVKI